ncbi:lipopolysaccharide biosynthesis protein [Streptomyces sp. KPB2]|uniref:lipopolysaccharide biosynthesis protein n=1 Tax=Streptomyces TaxID=1883 RepID=UPI000F707403|nr:MULTISPECIES: lipopolysaccharide biosynthesis protein [Streptomyces]AZM77646.1 lipopolysaccharide biosynthesis protein [Streptomyces sp. KPB2]WKX20943.1 lipopolysaccharide biosynthesis protein [Streptomyces sp. HUAS CX7]WSU03593.1 lipopolysaccharide biosynthesis protein [Streptomyces sp. NBC_01124]
MTEPLTQSPPEPATDPEPAPPARRARVRAALRRSLLGLRSLPPWSPLAAGVLAGGLIGAGYGLLATPQYTATSYVVAVAADESDPASALGFAQAYGRVATQLAVLGDAQMWAHVPVATLERSVRTATSPDAPMVSVTATSADPEEAADMANAVARALTRHADAAADDTRVELRQFARATEPTEPSSPSAAVTGLVGASAGGLLGGLALLVRPRRTGREPGRTAAAVPGPASAADGRGQL